MMEESESSRKELSIFSLPMKTETTPVNEEREKVSLEERGSYYEDFETNNLPKGEKDKTGDTHFDDVCIIKK